MLPTESSSSSTPDFLAAASVCHPIQLYILLLLIYMSTGGLTEGGSELRPVSSFCVMDFRRGPVDRGLLPPHVRVNEQRVAFVVHRLSTRAHALARARDRLLRERPGDRGAAEADHRPPAPAARALRGGGAHRARGLHVQPRGRHRPASHVPARH